MIDAERKKQAQQNLAQYLQDGLIKKGKNETAKAMYLKNAETSLHLAEDCIRSSLKPYLWTVVISYYSMFYIANAVLLDLGYKTSHKIVHKVTNEALIASVKSEEVIESYGLEMDKRSRFQYEMTESIQEQKAQTSLKRAKQFMFEMKKLLPLPKG